MTKNVDQLSVKFFLQNHRLLSVLALRNLTQTKRNICHDILEVRTVVSARANSNGSISRKRAGRKMDPSQLISQQIKLISFN